MTNKQESQKSAVYAAEDLVTFFKGNAIRTAKELEFWHQYATSLLKEEWFQDRFDLRKISLSDGVPEKVNYEVEKGAEAISYSGTKEHGYIFLVGDRRDELVILHEIAHLCVGGNDDKHGKDFCEVLLLLVERQMGHEMQSFLMQSFLYFKVEWEGMEDLLDGE